jgi:hypothetical protein
MGLPTIVSEGSVRGRECSYRFTIKDPGANCGSTAEAGIGVSLVGCTHTRGFTRWGPSGKSQCTVSHGAPCNHIPRLLTSPKDALPGPLVGWPCVSGQRGRPLRALPPSPRPAPQHSKQKHTRHRTPPAHAGRENDVRRKASIVQNKLGDILLARGDNGAQSARIYSSDGPLHGPG